MSLVFLVIQAHRVTLVIRGRKALRVLQALQVCRAHRVTLVIQASLVFLVFLVLPVLPVLPALPALQAFRPRPVSLSVATWSTSTVV